jgi:hypothetical protein
MRPWFLLLACVPVAEAQAVDRLSLQADSLQYGSSRVVQPRLALQLRSSGELALEGSAAAVAISGLTAPASHVTVRCASATLGDPWWACRGGSLRATHPRTGALSVPFELRWQRLQSRLSVEVQRVPLAGGSGSARLTFNNGGWQLERAEAQVKLAALRTVLQPWWTLPADLNIDGAASCTLTARGTGERIDSADVRVSVSELNLQNGAGTVVGEHVGVRLEAQIQGDLRELQASLRVSSAAGQALAGPVLLNLTDNPLTASLQATLDPARLALQDIQLQQQRLLRLHASALLRRVPAWDLRDATVIVDSLQFPAAYTSLLQLTVAAGILGNLETSGSASARLTMQDGVWQAADAQLDGLSLNDRGGRLSMTGLDGEAHWRPTGAAPAPSRLQWRQLRAFGIEAGAAEVNLLAQGRDLSLQRAVRIPVFDGALSIQRFSARALGTAGSSIDFDGALEPISMQSWSKAMGWPEMAGSLSGRIPGLHYSQGTLVLDGDLTADVFDGRVTVGKLRWRAPFGSFTQLSGDVLAKNLDLDLITRAFPIGSITGRLDADIRGLELFNWSAVAFDAQLQTTPGDRSRHRISQRAVGSIANIGGTGGGVVAALQSGFLRFFDDFGYDRIGLHCQLRNDVCLMDGIPRAGGGFYIVKGGGLPRIDIVGTQGRVAWAQVVGQITSAIESGGVIVR